MPAMIELVGGPYDGRRFMLSTDEHGFPVAMTLRMPIPVDPSVTPALGEGPLVLKYECEQMPEWPAVDPWLFTLVGQGPG